MQFIIDNDVPLEEMKIPKMVSDALKVLQTLEPGRLLTIEKLAQLSKNYIGSMRHFVANPAFSEWSEMIVFKGARRRLFGSKETIAAYRAKMKEQVTE